MPLANPGNRAEIAPRNTALHRRKRARNLAILLALAALIAIFYLVTIVRIQSGMAAGGVS
jgi:hypothetical protein